MSTRDTKDTKDTRATRTRATTRINNKHMGSTDKSIVIPFVRNPQDRNDISLLMVLDKKSRDWTFVVGGCKEKDELTVSCARRELDEETYGVIKMPDTYNETQIGGEQNYSSKRVHQHVYHIFIFELRGKDENVEALQRDYYKQLVGKEQFGQETSGITFIPLNAFANEISMRNIGVYNIMHPVIKHIKDRSDLFVRSRKKTPNSTNDDEIVKKSRSRKSPSPSPSWTSRKTQQMPTFQNHQNHQNQLYQPPPTFPRSFSKKKRVY